MNRKFKWNVRKPHTIIKPNGKKETFGPLYIKDLGEKGCWFGLHNINEKQLHHYYTLEQLENSKGFQEAIALGWLITLEKYIEEDDDKTNIEELKQKIATMNETINQLNQSPPIPAPEMPQEPPETIVKQIHETKVVYDTNENGELLKQILNELYELKKSALNGSANSNIIINANPNNIKKQKDILSDEIAIKSHLCEDVKKTSNFETLGTEIKVETNSNNILDALSDINIDTEDD